VAGLSDAIRARRGAIRARRRGVLIHGGYGLGAGVCITLLALAMSGAGHGWGSAAISAWALILLPATGVAWWFRYHGGALIAAAFIAVSMLAVDLALVSATVCEGTEYVAKAWDSMPVVLAAWAVSWFGAHLVPPWIIVIGVLAGMQRRRPASE
jgi:hypothetical protein